MLKNFARIDKENEEKKESMRRIIYLKPYSDITAAGSPFPTTIMSSFSNLHKEKGRMKMIH